jgi:hypothetical protein
MPDLTVDVTNTDATLRSLLKVLPPRIDHRWTDLFTEAIGGQTVSSGVPPHFKAALW